VLRESKISVGALMKTSKKRGFTNASEPKLCVAQHLSDCVKAESCSDIAKLLIGVGPAADRRALLVSNLQIAITLGPDLRAASTDGSSWLE